MFGDHIMCFCWGGYRYGFNGKEKDNNVKGQGNSYNFGARMYDPRVGRFLSIDPREKDYPYFTPYCYAGNSPIMFIDENGEGPILGMLINMFFGKLLVAKITGKTVSESFKAQVFAGVGPILSGGGSAHITLAADPKGNVAIVMGKKLFYDMVSEETGIGKNGASKEGNTALGAFAGIGYGINIHDKESVLDFAGNSGGNAGIDINLKEGEGVSGSVDVGEDNVGIGIGIGIGAGFAKIGSDNIVLATNAKDIEQFENANKNAQDLAKEKGAKVSLDYKISINNKKLTIDFTFSVVKQENGKRKTIGTFDSGKISFDTDNGSIYTGTVK